MKNKYKKYSILEVEWLDSHSNDHWISPSELKEWVEKADNLFRIKTLGYFIQEDKNFIRLAQTHDHQGLKEGSIGDNMTGLFAVSKNDVKSIKVIKK